jgi:hypothetical protein
MVERIIAEADVVYQENPFDRHRSAYDYARGKAGSLGKLLLTDKRLAFRKPYRKLWHPLEYEDVFQIPVEHLIGCIATAYDVIHRGKFVFVETCGIILVMATGRTSPLMFHAPGHVVWKSKIDGLVQSIKEGRVDQVVETPPCLVKNIENGCYGKALLTRQGKYLGGHTAHSDTEFGRMYLTERFFIFLADGADLHRLESPDKWNNWLIKVPLEKVIAAGQTPRDILSSSGKKLQIVLPYINENGIQQEPRFEIWRFPFIQNKQLMEEWARAIYARMAEIKRLADLPGSKPAEGVEQR